MTQTLSLATLPSLNSTIGRPSYDRRMLRPGILHIGVGNFHRSHQAVYLDDLFNAGKNHEWALIGAGVRPNDQRVRGALAPQDWLTTVVELEPEANTARICGAMVDFVPVGEDGRAIIDSLDDPNLRIVSLTVTEGGYCIDPATGAFNPDHPGDCLRRFSHGGAEGRIRRHSRGPEAPSRPAADALHGHVVRQHSGERSCSERRGRGARRPRRCRPRFLRSRIRGVSQQHGRPHHPCDDRSGAREFSPIASGSRTTGRFSASRSGNGCSRNTSRQAVPNSRLSA